MVEPLSCKQVVASSNLVSSIVLVGQKNRWLTYPFRFFLRFGGGDPGRVGDLHGS